MELGLLVPKIEKPGTNSQLKDKARVGRAWFGEGKQRKSARGRRAGVSVPPRQIIAMPSSGAPEPFYCWEGCWEAEAEPISACLP